MTSIRLWCEELHKYSTTCQAAVPFLLKTYPSTPVIADTSQTKTLVSLLSAKAKKCSKTIVPQELFICAPRPRTLYGVFKLCNEGTARIYWQDHGIPSEPWKQSMGCWELLVSDHPTDFYHILTPTMLGEMEVGQRRLYHNWIEW